MRRHYACQKSLHFDISMELWGVIMHFTVIRLITNSACAGHDANNPQTTQIQSLPPNPAMLHTLSRPLPHQSSNPLRSIVSLLVQASPQVIHLSHWHMRTPFLS